MTLDINSLKALAIGASEGPWYLENGMSQVRSNADDFVCETYENEPANSAFISAANPAAVLELIADVEHLRSLLTNRYVTGVSESKENDQLRAEVEALRQDAERYRWLRGRVPGSAYRVAGVIYSEGGDGVDAAIDAAMAKEGGHA